MKQKRKERNAANGHPIKINLNKMKPTNKATTIRRRKAIKEIRQMMTDICAKYEVNETAVRQIMGYKPDKKNQKS